MANGNWQLTLALALALAIGGRGWGDWELGNWDWDGIGIGLGIGIVGIGKGIMYGMELKPALKPTYTTICYLHYCTHTACLIPSASIYAYTT